MSISIIEQIIQDREWKNERILSWIRFFAFFVFTFFDSLAYFGFLSFTTVPPNETTMALDFIVILYTLEVLIILKRNVFLPYLKYFVILLDYLTVFTFFLLDASIPLNGSNSIYVIFLATVYFYLLNLLRYSEKSTIFAIVVASLFFEGNRYLFQSNTTEDLYPIRVALFIIFFLGIAITKAQKDMIQEVGTKKMMERYLSTELVGQLDRREIEELREGKSKNLSILFCDIREFTSLTETLEPKTVVQFLNHFFTVMTEQIESQNGVIDKFIGDAVFASFGLQNPELQSNHAILAAIRMQKAVSSLSIPIQIGIGIHSGEVILGSIGSERRSDYTSIGDTVNLASRIESLTKTYNCKILVSESTILALAGNPSTFPFSYREIDRVRVKGKKEPVTIFEILYT